MIKSQKKYIDPSDVLNAVVDDMGKQDYNDNAIRERIYFNKIVK